MTTLQRISTIAGTILLLVGAIVLLAACGTGGSAQATQSGGAAFHTTVKTTDGQFVIQFSVAPNRPGLNTFTVGVKEASSGQLVSHLQVRLFTTHLDMDMGTDEVDLQPDGPGQYSAQGGLSMSGHWGLRIEFQAAGTALHVASVKLDLQF